MNNLPATTSAAAAGLETQVASLSLKENDYQWRLKSTAPLPDAETTKKWVDWIADPRPLYNAVKETALFPDVISQKVVDYLRVDVDAEETKNAFGEKKWNTYLGQV